MKYLLIILTFSATVILACKTDNPTQQEQIETIDHAEILAKGKSIAMETYGILSSELQKAMQEGGAGFAVNACNIKALPLTDSLSQAYHAIIKRTSDKIRNPENRPTAMESDMIATYQQQMADGLVLKPEVKQLHDRAVFFAPIIINDQCLKCHGETRDLTADQFIQNLYPEDRAINYRAGDLRGIWSITFLK